MIRIGFLMNYPTSYKGGINYFRNLFFAINLHLKKEVECFLFVPDDLEQDYIDIFEPYVNIIKTNILKRNSSLWFIDKVFEKLADTNPLLDRLLLKHNIDVVSHSSYISKKVKTINWVMDFQHIHFPDLWNQREMRQTRKFLHRLITKSDKIFLSSVAAFNDYKLEYGEITEKVDILHFVSQPVKELTTTLSSAGEYSLRTKYGINRPFFYLPNQFWSHKNHKVVFEAIDDLKSRGLNPLLVTSGLMEDFRSKSNHIQWLRDFVIKQDLQENILFLGLIPYKDVLDLLTLSKCVINPSLFEGWSSTVEEAKTMGKLLVLSNIGVHNEQSPKYGLYFNPDDKNELSEILAKILVGTIEFEKPTLHELKDDLKTRTEKFAYDYLKGINKVNSL